MESRTKRLRGVCRRLTRLSRFRAVPKADMGCVERVNNSFKVKKMLIEGLIKEHEAVLTLVKEEKKIEKRYNSSLNSGGWSLVSIFGCMGDQVDAEDLRNQREDLRNIVRQCVPNHMKKVDIVLDNDFFLYEKILLPFVSENPSDSAPSRKIIDESMKGLQTQLAHVLDTFKKSRLVDDEIQTETRLDKNGLFIVAASEVGFGINTIGTTAKEKTPESQKSVLYFPQLVIEDLLPLNSSNPKGGDKIEKPISESSYNTEEDDDDDEDIDFSLLSPQHKKSGNARLKKQGKSNETFVYNEDDSDLDASHIIHRSKNRLVNY